MATRPYGSLFERLAGDTAHRAGLTGEESLMASVAAHLTRMLGTRAGSVQTLPDYGLPDLNDMNRSLHDVVMNARSAIEAFIRKYEPRLSSVRVTLEPGHHEALKLRFSIEGVLEAGGIKRQVTFNAHLGSHGQVSVTHD
ncbi:type VI secretion system baseplate subunit TssE [Pseudomonas sp. v388]|uniref:type VI secretion system baseplate subunit TssE n=1 Tax=Pseudomonas sp. v388 TaxID=2479849 RepID=UPI000F79F23E|nr:type VI secretion system baseplate subunit TssE [Pseudomonas sp. v388]RRV05321.1 type VI secretion system baseplate subunit TssE [Pseudomonas sp. v388]